MLTAASLVLLAATTAATAQDDEAAVRALRHAFNEAIAARQFELFGEFLMTDAETIGSNGTVLHGVEAYAAAIRARADNPDFVTYLRTPEQVTVGATDGLAAESGAWQGTWRRDGDETLVTGRYLAQWRRTDAGWRIHAELYVGMECRGYFCESIGMRERE